MGSRPALALPDILRGEGVDRVFGNPGTTELPFLAALSETDDAPEYVLGSTRAPSCRRPTDTRASLAARRGEAAYDIRHAPHGDG